MHMSRGVVGIEGVIICAAIFGHVLIFLFVLSLCAFDGLLQHTQEQNGWGRAASATRLWKYYLMSCRSRTCVSALLLASRVFAPLPMRRQLPMGVEDVETPSRA